ncbi:hypothetical protein Hamer_G000859 [Homarus americanus]|uniref:Uncharacterized protein n=1 Tax=Homarus americanus TaxID=6706 RepID=A0A8J5TFK2_HOMAM|nr:hypothetical protein Hamer_G000859 [Homarus americanus]
MNKDYINMMEKWMVRDTDSGWLDGGG